MNYYPLPEQFHGVQQFSGMKFNTDTIPHDAVLITNAVEGKIQYFQHGGNLVPMGGGIQGMPVTVPTVPTSGTSGHTFNLTQHTQQSVVINASLGWNTMNRFGDDTSRSGPVLNIPFAGQTGAAVLTMQPGHPTSVWPIRLVQSAPAVTGNPNETVLQPAANCKDMRAGEIKQEQDVVKNTSATFDRSVSQCTSVSDEPGETQKCTQDYLGSQSECYKAQHNGHLTVPKCFPPSSFSETVHHGLKYVSTSCQTVKWQTNMNMEPGAAGETENVNTTVSKKRKNYKKRLRPGEIRMLTALDGSLLFCCPECNVAYPERELLNQHSLSHKLQRRFRCNICDAALKRKEHLDQHMKGHNDDRPFQCTVCSKGFKRNEHLTRHYVIHSGIKDFVCVECGKAFARKDHLHKHTQMHIAKKVKAELKQLRSEKNTSQPVMRLFDIKEESFEPAHFFQSVC
ncbi:hypothetical protein PR048_028904 [Dryococelus australis]|uniref:C2H2-type domain-containing protein n=1 Tax=Dryococelus australis TaxID=614101 RepID=A0ABQ9GBV6_9NEOP|nr:hypothetical protein PR048_028904 [Dryococelus australis]